MAKYRIIENERIDRLQNPPFFTIEKRKLFGWRELKIIEQGSHTKRIKHATYQEAVDYMKYHYLGNDGILTIDGNVYTYIETDYGW